MDCTQEPLHHTQLRRSMSHSEPDLQVSFLDTTECDDIEYINMPPKPLTSITYLQQPLPPSKLPTKHPKVPGRVLTSMENMESMEERERERKDKEANKEERKLLREQKKKQRLEEREQKKLQKGTRGDFCLPYCVSCGGYSTHSMCVCVCLLLH